MTHPRITMFLQARDNAYARGDHGIIRAMNAELRRLGVKDTATIAHPEGASARIAKADSSVAVEERPPKGRPKLPRCEHGNVFERCDACNPEILAS